jgi:hypothetical protein
MEQAAELKFQHREHGAETPHWVLKIVGSHQFCPKIYVNHTNASNTSANQQQCPLLSSLQFYSELNQNHQKVI